jgi:membrane associated rhomboid family serine protease
MAIRFTVPPLTRVLLVSTILLSIIYGFVKYNLWMSFKDESRPDQYQSVPWITIVPTGSLYYPWVFVTATLVEGNIFTLIIAVNTIFHGGKYLERAWGSKDFGKFLLVVSIVPNLTTVLLYTLWFMLTGQTELAYDRPCQLQLILLSLTVG